MADEVLQAKEPETRVAEDISSTSTIVARFSAFGEANAHQCIFETLTMRGKIRSDTLECSSGLAR